MIRDRQQLEKALLYFQWVYIHSFLWMYTALHICVKTSSAYLSSRAYKKKKNPRTIFSHFADFLHYFSSQGIQVYSSSSPCSWVYFLIPLSSSFSFPVLFIYLYFLTSFIFLSSFSPPALQFIMGCRETKSKQQILCFDLSTARLFALISSENEFENFGLAAKISQYMKRTKQNGTNNWQRTNNRVSLVTSFFWAVLLSRAGRE